MQNIKMVKKTVQLIYKIKKMLIVFETRFESIYKYFFVYVYLYSNIFLAEYSNTHFKYFSK